MDNTQGLGAAMEESWQRDQAKSQDERIKIVEGQVRYLLDYIHRLERLIVADREQVL